MPAGGKCGGQAATQVEERTQQQVRRKSRSPEEVVMAPADRALLRTENR